VYVILKIFKFIASQAVVTPYRMRQNFGGRKFLANELYVFIFVGVNFHGFRGHLVIRENNNFVNPQKFFTL